jgi:hypothetical protein
VNRWFSKSSYLLGFPHRFSLGAPCFKSFLSSAVPHRPLFPSLGLWCISSSSQRPPFDLSSRISAVLSDSSLRAALESNLLCHQIWGSSFLLTHASRLDETAVTCHIVCAQQPQIEARKSRHDVGRRSAAIPARLCLLQLDWSPIE